MRLELGIGDAFRRGDEAILDIAPMTTLEGSVLGLGHPPHGLLFAVELHLGVVLADLGVVLAVGDGAVEIRREVDAFDPFGRRLPKRDWRPPMTTQMTAQVLPSPVTIDGKADGEDRIGSIGRDRAINHRR